MATVSNKKSEVHFALQRAKRKICNLQQQINETGLEETSLISGWNPSQELRDSLVDMYKENPGVNEELRQRLPSPSHQLRKATQLSHRSENGHWPQAPQLLHECPPSCTSSPLSRLRSASPVSPSSHRRSASPVSPLSHRRSPSPVSPPSHRRSASPVSPPSHRRSASPVSPLSHRRSESPLSTLVAAGVRKMERELSPSTRVSPQPETQNEGAAPVLPPRRHLRAVDSFPTTSKPLSLNQDKNVSFLLRELDSLRQTNNKLQEQLVLMEKELQRKELEEEMKEEQKEAKKWERSTDLLEEVLQAQKGRDQALMSRLLLANEERDEALLRIRRLQQQQDGLESVHHQDSDQDVGELLQKVCEADSGQEVQLYGSALVQRLQAARQRHKDITAEEMKAVMEERDVSAAKCKCLEELLQDKEQRPSEEALLRLQSERDAALEDRRRLEAELKMLRSNHSLTSPTPPTVAPPPRASRLQAPEAPPLLVQLQQLSLDKETVEAELHRCQEAERQANERVVRLERLVEVLRKKVGGGSLRAVI